MVVDMTLLYVDHRFREHLTGQHPERPERIIQVERQLERTGLIERCVRPTWSPADDDMLLRAHTAEYLRNVANFAALGGGRIEDDTVVSERSEFVARLAAGAAVDATQRVLRNEARTAFVLSRLPVIMR
ncbi:MAG: hypothetical protein QM811_13690 [Pirellulales bacterium]